MNKQFFLGFGVSVLVFVALITVINPDRKEISQFPIPEEMKAQMYFDIGVYYFNQDEDPLSGPYDLVSARHYFEEAARLNPKVSEELWYQYGRIDFVEGKLDDALDKFQTQMEYFGEDVPNVQYMKGLTYGYKAKASNNPDDWRQAELGFINFIPYVPEAPWPRVDLAWLFFLQGKYEEMKPVLEEGLLARPDNAWLNNMYGLSLLNTGDKKNALVYFVKAEEAALVMTVEEWGRAYPGNDQKLWGDSLEEFRKTIKENIALASQ